MTAGGDSKPLIGVVGLWHLGCTIAACWAELGYVVRGVDRDEVVVGGLRQGRPPLFEPGMADAIRAGLDCHRLSFSTAVETLAGCRFVFVAHDTLVRDDDSSDLTVIEETMARMAPHLSPGTIVVVSAQVPAGTARVFRSCLKQVHESLELVYSPENLRLGEALACYRRPGHIVIGADSESAAVGVEKLFAPMAAVCLRMSLPSAEMAKHAINSYLAASITLANQWADLCAAVGADFSDVAAAMRQDPRIGPRAYLASGIGFSGGTLGRDLQTLDRLNREQAGGRAPLFGEIWRYNKARAQVVALRCEQALGNLPGKVIALLGMTYKPGTSTLRRSLSLDVAEDLAKRGAVLRAFDPKADWTGARVPSGLTVCDSPYEAARGADLLAVLTEWPDFLTLDFVRIKSAMARPVLFDIKDMLKARHGELERLGFQLLAIGRA